MTISTELTVLQLDGFTMRLIKADDLDTLAVIWSDREVTRFLPSRGVPISTEQTKKALTSFVQHWQQRNYGIWAIIENASSQMIGYCGLRYLDSLNEVEVLYGLARAYWQRGITTQAAQAAIAYAFNVAKLDKVIGLLLPENYASKRVLEKAGLRYEKPIQMFDLDVVYYSLLSSD